MLVRADCKNKIPPQPSERSIESQMQCDRIDLREVVLGRVFEGSLSPQLKLLACRNFNIRT
jgi:hypothetical protein